MTLRLKSCDGQVFSVPVSEAKKFGTIRNMLENLSQSGTDFDEILPLPNVDSSTLKTLIDWSGESDTLKLDENSRLLDLVMAANYLDVPKLVDLGCQQISSLIRGKSAEEMKKTFGLKSGIAEETLAFHVVPLNDRALADLGHQAFCQHCHLDDLRILKTCSRCRLFKYCSLECQRADHLKHKVICGELASYRYEKESEVRLELSRQTRERRLVEMAVEDSLLSLGTMKSMYDLWFRILFALIDLGRDQDAFSFINWFLGTRASRFDDRESDKIFKVSCSIGEGPEPVLDHIPCLEVPIFVLLAVIKARFILTARKRLAEFDVFEKLLEVNDHRLLRVQPVVDVIAKNLNLCDDATLKQQEELFERYMDKIFAVNPTFLKAVVSPHPLVDLKRSEAIFDGSPMQALLLLIDSRKFFLENPVALRSVKRRVGENPVYDAVTRTNRVM